MARRVSILGITAAAQLLSQRVAIALLTTVAIGILIFAKTQEDGIAKLRLAVAGTLAPVFATLAEPALAVNRAVTNMRLFWSTYEENQRLRQELLEMQLWRSRALSLEQQNKLFAGELKLRIGSQPKFVTAPIIADSGGPFVRTRLLRAGLGQGVAKDQAAVARGVLVGRVMAAGEYVSRLLLLTDLNSRVPVLIEVSRVRGILAGDNSDRPQLLYTPLDAKLNVGDQVVTSGHAGVFPPGLPIGRIAVITKDHIRIKPFLNYETIEYVSVLQQSQPISKDEDMVPMKADGENKQRTDDENRQYDLCGCGLRAESQYRCH